MPPWTKKPSNPTPPVASNSRGRKPKALPVEVAPRPAPPVASTQSLPSFLRHGKAGAVVAAPGPGEMALDEVCQRNGWTWAKAATYTRDGKPRVSILIGTIIEGEAPEMDSPSGPYAAKLAEDAAMGDVARFLMSEYEARDGDPLHRTT